MTVEETSVIATPLPVNQEFTYYNINPSVENILEHRNGSKLLVPANAFLDINGNIVEEQVDIQYREFHDPVDQFLSGIPMVYDSAGLNYTFMSAGMCEFRAYAGEEELQPNPDNPITVEMASFQNGTEYNMYTLNEQTGQWNNIGKDVVEEVEPPADPPNVPSYWDSYVETFDIGDDTGTQPELEQYVGWLFQPVDKNEKINGWSRVSGIDVKVLGNNRYIITFSYWQQSAVTVLCERVYDDDATYSDAYKRYEKELAAYYEEYGIDYYGIQQAKRSFDLMDFGVINCDAPILKQYNTYQLSLAKIDGSSFDDLTGLTHIDFTLNSSLDLIRYSDLTSLKFDPENRNMIVAIDSQGNVYGTDNNDFSLFIGEGLSLNLNLILIAESGSTWEEIKEAVYSNHNS